MWSRIIAISVNTFLETIRQPIYGVILIVTAMMMLFNVSLAAYTLSDDNLFLQDLGLSTLLVSGLFLAAFSAAGVLSREIENKTVMTILSKPVSRPVLIVGKYLGLLSALTVAFYIGTLVLLFVVRHKVMQNTTDPWDMPAILFGFGSVLLTLLISGFGNYWYGWQFSSTAILLLTPLITIGYLLTAAFSPKWELQFPFLGDANLLAAIILVLMVVWIISAVALAASTRLGQVATLTLCAVFLMLGLTSDFFFGQHPIENAGFWGQPTHATQLCWLSYRVMPNLGIFWVTDGLSTGKYLTLSYLTDATAYALAYIIAIVLVGIALFQNREVG